MTKNRNRIFQTDRISPGILSASPWYNGIYNVRICILGKIINRLIV